MRKRNHIMNSARVEQLGKYNFRVFSVSPFPHSPFRLLKASSYCQDEKWQERGTLKNTFKYSTFHSWALLVRWKEREKARERESKFTKFTLAITRPLRLFYPAIPSIPRARGHHLNQLFIFLSKSTYVSGV